MAIDPKWIVNLKGKSYPTWPGVLHAATEAGLRSLVATIVQIPAPENGHLAVVLARAEFEDGRVFEDVGDCSPASTSPQLAAAALRLASTRAKGRCLRDAIDVGETMYEELPNGQVEGEDEERGAAPTRAQGTSAPRESTNGGEVAACEEAGCGVVLTEGQRKLSQQKYQKNLCPIHQRAVAT